MVTPYTLIDSYHALNVSLCQVLESIVEVTVFEVPDAFEATVRLTESTFNVAERMERITPVVTAHDLSQYVNRFYSLDLEGSNSIWLDFLIEELEDTYIGGLS